jgi:TonB family protein
VTVHRPFLVAVLISLLWHFFWFFSISITVSPYKRVMKPRPHIVALGPVLDDTLFRTLVENKPQLSETFYRRLTDFSPVLNEEVKTLERQSAGDVVSLPYGKKMWSSLKDLVSGEKPLPDFEFAPKVKAKSFEEKPDIRGEVADRHILSRPSEPSAPAGLDPAFREAETELSFTVTPAGFVNEAKVLASSGSPELDLVWERYLRQWQFAPLGLGRPASDQKGRVRFHFQGRPRRSRT